MGGSDSGTRVGIQVLLLVALTIVFFAAAGYVPVLGVIVSFLAPTPLLLVTLYYGQQAGLLALGLSTVSLTLLLGLFQGAIFLAEYGVMALTMAETIRRKWSVERMLLASTVVPLLSTGLVMAVLLSSTSMDFTAIRQHVEQDLGQALPPQFTAGDEALDRELRSYIQQAVSVAIRILPALLILSTAVSALINYSVVRYLWQRRGHADIFPELALARWKAPEACIWVLIAGGLCAITPQTSVQMIGVNVLLLVGLLYVIQGLGILVFYFQKTSVPPLFRSLAYLFLIIQPLLLLGVAAFGLFDLWFDFRRLSHKREEQP